MPELVEWGLLRVVTPSGAEGICAAGTRVNHPHERSRIVVTSQVRSISADRRQLITQHTTYDLSREIPEFPASFRREHVWMLYHKARKTVPQRVEWLRPDGSIYAAADSAEIKTSIKAEEESRRTGLPSGTSLEDFGEKLLKRKGSIDPDAPIEF